MRNASDAHNLDDELFRVARRLHLSGRRRIGIVPIGDELRAAPTAVRLAIALADAFTGAAVVVDPTGVASSSDARVVVHASSPERPVEWIEEVLSVSADAPIVLVSLAGLRARGDHVAAIDLLDGVFALARTGKTSEADLRWFERDVDRARQMGVLLVD